jgi:elongation factor 2
MDGIDQVLEAGPLAREPCTKLLVRIHDLKLHEDAIHRGPSQVLPAVREALREAMMLAGSILLEPMQVLMIECPESFLGEMSRLVQNKRGQLLDVTSEGGGLIIKAKLPVSEMFGLSSDLRSATEGRGNFFISDQVFEKLPESLKEKTVKNIRTRKGLGLDNPSV